MNDFDDLCMNCFAYRRGKEKCPDCGVLVNRVEWNRAALEPGTILAGKYLIGRVLGQGGFGITYLGFDLNLKSKIAIKEFYPNGLMARRNGHVYPINDENQEIFKIGVDNFYAEAENLARFRSNPVIVNVYDFFRANGTAYIVMEKITGKPLEAVLAERGGKFSFDETLKILNPIMDALSTLHDGGLLHRDVAPDNIFLAEDGRIRLIDFGAIQPNSADSENSALTIVKSGFAPVEQYTASGKQGPWTDIYALAALFYRCLIGRNVPDAPDRLSGNDDELQAALSGVANASVRKALLKALTVDPSGRYQSVAEFRAALNEPPNVTLNARSGTRPDRGTSKVSVSEERLKENNPPEKSLKSSQKEKSKSKGKSSLKTTPPRQPRKKSGGIPFAALFVIFALLAGLGAFVYMNWIQPQRESAASTGVKTETVSVTLKPTERIAPTTTEQKRAVLPTRTHIPPTAIPTSIPREPNRKREIDGMTEVNVILNGRSFWIDAHEISYAEYNYFYKQNDETAALKPKTVQDDAEPIVNVSRTNAAKYCAWVGGRLPTYEEWKAAAGVGTVAIVRKQVNCSGERVSLVTSNLHPSGKFGAYDLYGNVWEWINATANADLMKEFHPAINLNSAVIGGSFKNDCAEILNAKEVLVKDGTESGDIGFRCARDE